MDRVAEKVSSLGYRFRIDPPQRPFDLVKVVGNFAYVSGHGPTNEHGELVSVGQVGSAVSLSDAVAAARLTAVNCLGSLKRAVGDLERVEEVVKVLAFVNSAPGFYDQPLVANGFTELLLEVFGEKGRHSRSAIGASSLPGNQSFEAEMLVRIR